MTKLEELEAAKAVLLQVLKANDADDDYDYDYDYDSHADAFNAWSGALAAYKHEFKKQQEVTP
tara:strand:+ start:3438 stop:3626 length:189 start_codon:yes stop_codon:yes gene_type:complete